MQSQLLTGSGGLSDRQMMCQTDGKSTHSFYNSLELLDMQS